MNDKEKAILLSGFDDKHLRNAMKRKKVLDLIWDSISKEAAKIGKASGFNDPEAEFHFDDYPQTQKLIDKLLAQQAKNIEVNIVEGNKEAWLLSEAKNKTLIKALTKGKRIDKATVESWIKPNTDALEAFQSRKVAGMGLSDRVWNITKQTKAELELALDIGLGEGKSAAALSRDVRKYLNEPNKLFRRVRDKHGNLRLSKAAAAYHPGQGVYRSSYKNALRMTGTENNMAYRSSDHQKWNQLGMVIGQKIELSNNHTIKNAKGKPVPFHDICDLMIGEYPKEFKFTGWHPHCRCISTPKLADWDEYMDYKDMVDDGKDVSNYHFKGEVTDVPPGYKKWMEDNADRVARAKSMSYFIKENYVGGSTAGGFRWEEEKKRASILERAAARHAARTPEMIRDIQDRWALREDEMQYSPEQRSMFRVIEKRLGIKRGFSMPHERADLQNANPNYGKNKGYSINCQTCAPAYQLRRWGFDVTAKMNPKQLGNLSTYLSKGNNWRETWVDGNFKHIGTKSFNEFLREKGYKQMSDARYKEYFKEVCNEDGVYEIGISWKGGGGHCTIVERRKGKFYYVEPQVSNARGSGREWDDFDNLCKSMTTKPYSKDGAIRCDNALFDKKFLDIFEPNKAVPLHTQRVLNNAAIRHEQRSVAKIKEIKAAWKEREKKQKILKAAAERHAKRNDAAVQSMWDQRKKQRDLILKQASNVAKVANKTPWIDAMEVAEMSNEAYYVKHLDELKQKTTAMVAKIQSVNKEIKQLETLIPDAKTWTQKFDKAELQSVYKNVEGKLAEWHDKWLNDPWIPQKYASENEYFLHKITTEINYVITTGKTKYTTWEVAESAYTNQLNIVHTKIWAESADAKIKEMEAFAASHKKSPIFAEKLKGLKDAYNLALKGDKTAWNDTLNELELKKHDLELRDAQRARKKAAKNGGSQQFGAEAYTQQRKDNAVWAKDGMESYQELGHQASDAWSTASRAEKEAIHGYTLEYCNINEPLRGLTYYGSLDKAQRGLNRIPEITNLLERTSLENDMWFQRGDGMVALKKFGLANYDTATDAEIMALVGKEGVEGAFWSMGTSKGDGFSGKIIFNIYAPKTTKGMYCEPFSGYGHGARSADWDGTLTQTSVGRENEFLMQRGTKFRVTKVEKSNGTWFIDLDVIEQNVLPFPYVGGYPFL